MLTWMGKWRRYTFGAGASGGILALWALLGPLLADALIVERPVERADAIVILSGAADHAQRARGGAEAFNLGVAPKVILTDGNQRGGWDDTEKGNPYFIERAAAELARQGVPAGSIEKLPDKVQGTGDEADLIVRIAAERGYRSVLIVTSDYHSRRALWTFERAAARSGSGLTLGLMRSPSGPNYPGRWTWWLGPRGWRTVGAEYLKFGYYWFFY